MPNTPKKDDPSATYRGYRRQALYCLYRLFDDGLAKNYIIQPEGVEDLAIWDGKEKKLIEVVQVKDYSEPLTASSFTPFFYERIHQYCHSESQVKVTLASFGELGNELTKALTDISQAPERTVKTIQGKDKYFSEKQAKEILAHLKYVRVDEKTLTDFVYSKLNELVTSGQPQQAFENFMWWLFIAAEKKLELTRQSVIEKLNNLGRFLAQRNASAEEWYNSILPITLPNNTELSADLRDDFFQGGRVRMEHIASNLDVRRPNLLTDINHAFSKNNVVVIHAASGQGKTTLAYRYLLEFGANEFRFEILKPNNLSHARRMATALAGHYEAISLPTLVYLDVRPSDVVWKEFVSELSKVIGIRILITIREDDWFRSRVTAADFSFAGISLQFDEVTAEPLFNNLVTRYNLSKYLDFQDAWMQLGERKTLFEFIYLLTQEQSLAEKIQQQIAVLQDEVNAQTLAANELKLLRLVAVASAYEARITVIDLVKLCEIAEPVRTLQRFNNEFLLRTSSDGQFVEGFHAIRSELMCQQLLDEVFYPWHEIAAQVLTILHENDLEFFLLCAFSRHYQQADYLVQALTQIKPKNWQTVLGISRALQWLGLKTYAQQNFELLSMAHTLVGRGWWFLINFDIANAQGEKKLDLITPFIDSMPNFALAAQASTVLKERQTDSSSIFEFFSDWIISLKELPKIPEQAQEFIALTEVLFWLGHFKIKNTNLIINEYFLNKALEILPIYEFGKLAMATRLFDGNLYMQWYEKDENVLKSYLQQQAGIFALKEEDDCLVSNYIIALDEVTERLGSKGNDEDSGILSVYNSLSVERSEITAWVIPNYAKYGATGYGYTSLLVKVDYDPTSKRMPIENIMKPFLPEFNAWFRGVVEYEFRSANWLEYFSQVGSLRSQTLEVLGALTERINKIDFQSKANSKLFLDDMDLWNSFRAQTTDAFLLPRSAVDEWGFIIDTQQQESTSTSTQSKYSTVQRFRNLERQLNKYRQAVGDFVRTAEKALVLMILLPAAKNNRNVAELYDLASKEGITEHHRHLSVCNSIDAYIGLKKLHQEENKLLTMHSAAQQELQAKELSNWPSFLNQWCRLAYPQQFPSNIPQIKQKEQAGSSLKQCLIPTLNRLKDHFKPLKKHGIKVQVYTDEVSLGEESALWISFDTEHPIASLSAIAPVWNALVEAFKPDQDKIVRIKAMDLYWQRIIVVPLVRGKSIERLAYTHFKGATQAEGDGIETQQWRLFPEAIPLEIWSTLGLEKWEFLDQTQMIERFAKAYGSLFGQVDHVANFAIENHNCDEIGKTVLVNYLDKQSDLIGTYGQEALASLSAVIEDFGYSVHFIDTKPNLILCREVLLEVGNALHEFLSKREFSLEELKHVRDELLVGLHHLGLMRYLWIADAIGCESPSFDF